MREGESSKLKLKWQEKGGPQVAQPIRQGFGTVLLKAIFPDACFDYAVEGLNCEIDVLMKTDDACRHSQPRKRVIHTFAIGP